MTPHQIIQALEATRTSQGVTVTELARRAGLARPGVSKALHGRKQPCLGTVVKLAAALGLTLTLRA